MTRRMRWMAAAACALLSAATLMAADGSWLHKVPASERGRVNPLAGQTEAVAAGKLLFAENCAKCHGDDALGRHERPSLRSERIARATDGEIAWMLRNGNRWKGMPSWSALPEPQRWQIISYLRSLQTEKTLEPTGEKR